MNAAGAGPRPARGLLPGVRAFKTSPSSASLRSAPSPYKGEGLRAATWGRPYGGNGPGTLVQKRQAQE